MVSETLLLHELQLGNKLSNSIHGKNQRDFALMLAMLSTDVREQSQFYLPENTTIDEIEVNLRKELGVPPAQRLCVEDSSDLSEFNQVQWVGDHYATIRLKQALRPLPLNQEDNVKKIPDDVLTNTRFEKQLRQYKKLSSTETLNQSVGFNVPSWLDNIETSRTATI